MAGRLYGSNAINYYIFSLLPKPCSITTAGGHEGHFPCRQRTFLGNGIKDIPTSWFTLNVNENEDGAVVLHTPHHRIPVFEQSVLKRNARPSPMMDVHPIRAVS
ncbi:5918_t:CDS:2 [Paraglomus brasilianum]|uniref:5918_t:CDS:1 n=1 Tax=Paraglomus brasilianum TaxID=144538 RepID=A0A9N9H4T1_9GLOM|nr:5918_t:CDS:2 [Paraglomus brasilianum]